jgi:hypothetical protein
MTNKAAQSKFSIMYLRLTEEEMTEIYHLKLSSNELDYFFK